MATTYTVNKCSVDACTKKHDSHGLCASHRSKVNRHGSAFGPFKPARIAKVCGVEDCSQRAARYGYCGTHYKWKERTGDASVRPPKAEWFFRSAKNKRSRYRYVNIKDHPILGTTCITEHRFIMTEFIGRKLLSSENIHHINGDGKDNRIENLELWTTFQPPGQRIEDKVSYAIELLKQYKPEVLKEGI
jgi:hypothetical protein